MPTPILTASTAALFLEKKTTARGQIKVQIPPQPFLLWLEFIDKVTLRSYEIANGGYSTRVKTKLNFLSAMKPGNTT